VAILYTKFTTVYTKGGSKECGTTALPEHMEYSSWFLEHMEQSTWNSWLCGAPGAECYSLCSQKAAAQCALFHLFGKAAVPCAPGKLLYMCWESSCSTWFAPARPVKSHALGLRLVHLRSISCSRLRLKSHAFTSTAVCHVFSP